MIYLDNAATSWPKPEVMLTAMEHFTREVGANPGRSAHRLASKAEQIRFEAREALATLFNIRNPLRVIFTPNATHALNLVFQGLLKPGDHVVTTSMEHNSVMRPLNALGEKDITVSFLPCNRDGTIQVAGIKKKLRSETRLVVVNHASNVCGTIQPLQEIAREVKASNALFLVDAAQTAGTVAIDMGAEGIDLLVFSGHKGLLGPTGTGGLVIGEQVDARKLRPFTFGGTGSLSQETRQPETLPDKYESGTGNIIGIAGLGASVRWILQKGVANIRVHELKLTRHLLQGLTNMANTTVYGTGDANRQTATISFNIKGKSPSAIGLLLDEEFEIMCRVGLHCAPAAHRTLKTFPDGTIRFSLGIFNKKLEVEKTLKAVSQLQ